MLKTMCVCVGGVHTQMTLWSYQSMLGSLHSFTWINPFNPTAILCDQHCYDASGRERSQNREIKGLFQGHRAAGSREGIYAQQSSSLGHTESHSAVFLIFSRDTSLREVTIL